MLRTLSLRILGFIYTIDLSAILYLAVMLHCVAFSNLYTILYTLFNLVNFLFDPVYMTFFYYV